MQLTFLILDLRTPNQDAHGNSIDTLELPAGGACCLPIKQFQAESKTRFLSVYRHTEALHYLNFVAADGIDRIIFDWPLEAP